ncbi:hypothetical protein PVL29_019481 [Vitis rotundifolia]|uniref:Uncharacterized protein n=1 Tax=Vitis rotundifolia TaxID=103349 RepID=A0AA38Z0M6_VITRO|nr:hypothetical protein PVL29_019481 [Vitis rotundifolia]
MSIHNQTSSIHHITVNIVGINLQEQRNLMFIQSSNFINNGKQQNLMLNYLSAILALISFVVPVLISLIDLKFQKEADSVFEAHPITTMMFFASLLAFVSAFGTELTFHSSHLSPTCAALLRTAMMFSGSLCLASLASVLLPDALRPLLYAFYALLSLANLHNLVRKWYHWVHRTIVDNLETVLTGMRQWRLRRRGTPSIVPIPTISRVLHV